MSKRKCAVLEAVIAELRAAGLFYTVSRGGKHWKVAFIHNGRERLGSDWLVNLRLAGDL
jgi:hypothetical protein